MELVFHLLILAFNTIFYLTSFYLIIKRRKHPAISVRSPILLFFNNLGGFLMTNIFLIYELLENYYKPPVLNSLYLSNDETTNFHLFCKILPNNYLICHFLMIFSFVLRCQRILACCKINNDERTEIELFYTQRYKFKERYYIQILFYLMCIITFINFLINLCFPDLILIPYHFEKCFNQQNYLNKNNNFINNSTNNFFNDNVNIINDNFQNLKDEFQVELVSFQWILVNFIEHIILVTYSYFLTINPIKQLIKLELNSFFVIWIIYPNFLRASQFFLQKNNPDIINNSHWTSYVCVLFLYLCLILNGYIPIITSFLEENKLKWE